MQTISCLRLLALFRYVVRTLSALRPLAHVQQASTDAGGRTQGRGPLVPQAPLSFKRLGSVSFNVLHYRLDLWSDVMFRWFESLVEDSVTFLLSIARYLLGTCVRYICLIAILSFPRPGLELTSCLLRHLTDTLYESRVQTFGYSSSRSISPGLSHLVG
jgi:hypothetical protein